MPIKRDALIEPGGRRGCGRREKCVRKGVGKDAVELLGRGLTNGGGEKRAGFKGSVFGVGQIEEGELGARLLAEPALKKWSDRGGGRGPIFDGGFVSGQRKERGVSPACLSVRMARKRLGASNAEDGVVKRCRGDARDFIAGGRSVSDSERRGVAVDECDGGRLAVRKFGGETQAEARAGHAEFVLTHFVEDAGAVAENDGNAGGRDTRRRCRSRAGR